MRVYLFLSLSKLFMAECVLSLGRNFFMEANMNTLRSLLTVLAIGAVTLSAANARDSYSIGINVGGHGDGYGHGYHEPIRYYSAPHVVYEPTTYYYEPVRSYYHAPVVSYRYYGGGHHYNGHHARHYDRGHGWGNGHRGHYNGHRGGDRGDHGGHHGDDD